MLQIVFNEISAAEISQLDTLEQLELLDEFKVGEEDLAHLEDEQDARFGRIAREGKVLYRFRSRDWRFYFEVVEKHVVVHRVLHRNTFQDFLYRSQLPLGEDEELAKSKQFWRLIDEGRNARPVS